MGGNESASPVAPGSRGAPVHIALTAGVAAIGGFLFGFDTAVINGAVGPVTAVFHAKWIANFAVSTTFPTLSSVSLALAYGIYAAMALLSFVFVFSAVRETKGKELEHMQA